MRPFQAGYVPHEGVEYKLPYGVILISVKDNGGGCDSCYGGQSVEICDSLPSGCMDGRYIWEEKK